MSPRLIILIGFLASIFATVAAGEQEPPILQDQFGNSGSLSDYAGEPVLAIVTSPRKLRWIGRWEESIRADLPELVSIRIADATGRRPPTYEKLASILRRHAPDDVSVLIDMQRYWATTYELDTREPCLVLFDSNHDVVAKFRGRPKGALVDEVMIALRAYFPESEAT